MERNGRLFWLIFMIVGFQLAMQAIKLLPGCFIARFLAYQSDDFLLRQTQTIN